ncbi:hypothetical protein FNV43_RR25594 [Rhamnella rubrinervis]|uniref:DUF4378 domain-containing protein n=1 Tax=Rhamnella rubrinervis TaxID=2594499 RepID=A0A8K0DTF8_9ROSA|nr:hypothetical protein FNV43_RR25594 [Rhamnella rubrinervis]
MSGHPLLLPRAPPFLCIISLVVVINCILEMGLDEILFLFGILEKGLDSFERMNDGVGKGSSCLSLAVAEKRTHRPGGCVGIFFQLFDWNRRFAKKKLFSKKLLPPARAKQASKKFKGGEKMPMSKLHLIADENSGGFPNMTKHHNRSIDIDHKHEMRAPGLVARLMGLESMPTLRDKPKKVSLSDSCDNGKCINSYNSGGEFVNSERGNTKLESRPQKLQKTGQVQRKAVTRFGADALQIKSVLSRSRKLHHHHPIPVSPVKSPRIPLSKNVSRTSRLIDAATKILEPAANKSKCAIIYPTSVHYPLKNEVIIEETLMKSEELTNKPGYCANATNCLVGKTSWQNCGNLLDIVNVEPNAAEQPSLFPPFTSNFVNVSSEGKGRSNPRTSISSFGHGHDTNAFFQRNRDQAVSPTQRKEEVDNRQWNSKPVAERNSMPQVGDAPWQSSTHSHKPQNHERVSVNLKHRTQMQDQMPFGRYKTPSRSKLNNLQSRRGSSAANACRGTKDFVALNRSLSGRTRPRVPTKVEGSKVDSERKAIDGRDESSTQFRSSVRKRTINVGDQVESGSFITSTGTRQRNAQFDPQSRIGLGPDAQSIKHSCVRSRLIDQRDDNRAKNKSTDVISFTFNSPIRHNTEILKEVEEKTTGSNIQKFSSKPLALKRDSIGALLEQKLNELTIQEQDELATGGPRKRSTAMILQELISALTSEHPDVASPSFAERECGRSAKISHNGHRLHPNYMDCSDDHLQSLESDAELLHSATSWNKESDSKRVKALVSHISKLLYSMSIAGGRLPESKLAYAREAILNAELSFGDVTPNNEDGMESLLITPILLKLETSENSIWTNMNVFTGLAATKVGDQFNEFLFDCLIECIDSRYSKCCNSGFRTWRRRPLCMTSEMIIQEVEEDIKRWAYFAGMITDEIVESEMSHSLGKWTDFDIEVFETAAEIDSGILHILVDEIVTDLWECMQGSVLHLVQI